MLWRNKLERFPLQKYSTQSNIYRLRLEDSPRSRIPRAAPLGQTLAKIQGRTCLPHFGRMWRRHKGRHDTQHKDFQHNDIQHNDTQHNDTQHNNKENETFNIMSDCCYAQSRYAQCGK